jgi:hypothetical protein
VIKTGPIPFSGTVKLGNYTGHILAPLFENLRVLLPRRAAALAGKKTVSTLRTNLATENLVVSVGCFFA